MPSISLSIMLVACGAMLWGSDVLLRPNALRGGWSSAALVLGEHLLLTAAFAIVLWRGRGIIASLTPRQWGALLAVSWGGSALATWLYTQSFMLGSPLTSILLQKTQPVFALLLAGLVLRERRSSGFWLWCGGAIVGAWLLTGISSLPSLHDVHWRQALCALGASALWGGATVAGRALSRTLTPGLLAGSRFAFALPVLALLTWLTPGSRFPTPGPHLLPSVGILLLIVLLPDLAGMALYYRGLRGTPASVATLAELCYPLTSLLIGLGLLHLRLSPGQWLGLILLLGAVFALGRRPQAVRETQPVSGAPIAVP